MALRYSLRIYAVHTHTQTLVSVKIDTSIRVALITATITLRTTYSTDQLCSFFLIASFVYERQVHTHEEDVAAQNNSRAFDQVILPPFGNK